MLTSTTNIVKMFEYIVSDVQTRTGITIHYEHGSRKNIDDMLMAWGKNQTTSARKYPLIALIQPFTERAVSDGKLQSEVTLKIVIATLTNPKYLPDEREVNTFDATLRPMYNALLYSIEKSGYFFGAGYPDLPHDHTDLYEWGENGGTVFCDYVDAILIENLQLKVKKTNLICSI